MTAHTNVRRAPGLLAAASALVLLAQPAQAGLLNFLFPEQNPAPPPRPAPEAQPPASQPSGPPQGGPASQTAPPRANTRGASPTGGGTYRTLCVRMCDGFYFPLSYKATRSKFAIDTAHCAQQCTGARTRLFVYRNPGQSPKQAVDLQGNRYVGLDNAFRYRKELVKGCSCDADGYLRTTGGQGQ